MFTEHMRVYIFLFSKLFWHLCIECYIRTTFCKRTWINIQQRTIIVLIARMPSTRTSLIILLPCYLLIIVVHSNHSIRFGIVFFKPPVKTKFMYPVISTEWIIVHYAAFKHRHQVGRKRGLSHLSKLTKLTTVNPIISLISLACTEIYWKHIVE